MKYRVPPLLPTYISEWTMTFAINVRCYGEHVGEHIGNLGEHIGNPMGTEMNIVTAHWEPGKK